MKAGTLKLPRALLLFCDYHPSLLDVLCEALDHAGLAERILIRKRGSTEWGDGKTRVVSLPMRVFGEGDPPSFASVLSLIAYLIMATAVGTFLVMRRRLDAIVGVFGFPQGLVAVLVGLLTRRKVAVLTDGGDIDVLLGKRLTRQLMLFSLRRANSVAALNETKAHRLVSLGLKAKLCRIEHVNTSRFAYAPMADKEEASVLYVGRFSDEKCPEVLVKACNRLWREGVNLKLLMVGEGPLKSKIADTVAKMGMTDATVLKGGIPHSEIHRFFREASVYVLPSRREGVSVSLLEAMSSGCLCIASDIPDNRELIQHMYNGILFHVDDVEDLATKVKWAISNPSEVGPMVSRARYLVEDRYSLQAVGKTLGILVSSLTLGDDNLGAL